MSEQFDLNYRPDTYWPEALDQEQLLSRIKGECRRIMARDILAEDGVGALNKFLATEDLSEVERRHWGAIHPDFMGGEYLPGLLVGEVEIARISLASTTRDQISIRALQYGEKIRYTVFDEYDTQFELAFTESEQSLTLGELIVFLDQGGHPEETKAGGLLVCHWEQMYEWDEPLDRCLAFAWIQSAWYSELADYYAQVASDWRAKKESEQEVEEPEFDKPVHLSIVKC